MKNKTLVTLVIGLALVLLWIFKVSLQINQNPQYTNVYFEKEKLDCNKYAAIYASMTMSQVDNEKDFVKSKFVKIRLQEVFQKINDLCELDLKNIEKYKKLMGSTPGSEE
ncbi:MAG: hypothetical protein U0525_04275 [Patescibacteria group bacterium]